MEEMDLGAQIFALNEERQRAWESNKSLLQDTKGDLSAEQREQWDRTDAVITELDHKRNTLLSAERREREAADIREANLSVFGEQRIVQAEQTEEQRLRAFLTGKSSTLEVDLRPAMEQSRLMRMGYDVKEARALAWDTGNVGSTVPVTTASSLYGYMEASVAMFRMPTTKINTNGGEVMYFPKLASHAIATQVKAQGTALAGTDPGFSRMQLDAYKYGELIRVASEVLQDTGVNLVEFIGRDMGRALGRVIDGDLVTGSGSSKPNGIQTAIGGAATIVTGGTLIDPTVEKYIDTAYSVVDEYRNLPSSAWLMHDLTAAAARKLRDGAGGTVGAFLWAPSLTEGVIGGQPSRFLSFPVYTDPNVASLASDAKVVYFGAWEAYYIRTVGPVQLDRDDSRYFDTDESAFRAKWRVDGDCIDTTAFNAIHRAVT